MTIRMLERFLGAPVEDHPGGVSPDVSLAFALDGGYLELFKVCLRSLAHSGNFLDCPIVLYTDDPAVLDDPVVKEVVDRPVLLGGARRDVLHGLAETSVRQRDRASWNRGTFLKWAVFEPQPTRRLVFLDVDMIFLRRFDTALLDAATAPFSCCPQFRQSMTKSDDGELLAANVRLANFHDALAGRYSGKLCTNVNSGLMVLDGAFLTDAFFDEITEFAAQKRQINEQLHFTSYFMDRPEELRMMTAGYNFQETYLIRTSWKDQQALMKSIDVLHYAGSPKPWNSVPNRANFRPSSAVWHWHRSMAQPLFDARTASRPRPPGSA